MQPSFTAKLKKSGRRFETVAMSCERNRLKDNCYPYYDNYAAICIGMRVFMANFEYISIHAFIAEVESFQYITVSILIIMINSQRHGMSCRSKTSPHKHIFSYFQLPFN